jgi:hypothetical protein
MKCVFKKLSAYDVKIVLLTEHIPACENKYICDFICCNLHEQSYIDTLRLYQKNVGKFDSAIVHKSHDKIAYELKNTFEIPVTFLTRSLSIPSINDLQE